MAQAFDKQLQDLIDDNRSGSREITARAAALFRGMLNDQDLHRGELIATLRLAARRLEKAHVSLAAVRSFCDAVLLIVDSAPPREQLIARLLPLLDQWNEIYAGRITLQIASQLMPLLRSARCIVSHSRSLTVLAVLRHLKAKIANMRIIQTVSWPMREGIGMARELAAEGFTVELIADGGLAAALQRADLAVVGADSISAEGVVNKQGTLALALAGRHFDKPVVALADIAKIQAESAIIEQRDPRELLEETIPGVTPLNVYFELVPLELFTAIITERGAFDAHSIREMLASMSGRTVPAADEELR